MLYVLEEWSSHALWCVVAVIDNEETAKSWVGTNKEYRRMGEFELNQIPKDVEADCVSLHRQFWYGLCNLRRRRTLFIATYIKPSNILRFQSGDSH
jgi:hypothetical protein